MTQRLDPAEAWDRIGRTMTRMDVDELRYELDDALYEIVEAIDEDDLDEADLNAARKQLAWAREYIEMYLVPLVDGAEEWDNEFDPCWEPWFAQNAEGGDR